MYDCDTEYLTAYFSPHPKTLKQLGYLLFLMHKK